MNRQILKKKELCGQIEYMDRKIITMLNRLNNISFENYRVASRQIVMEETPGGRGDEQPSEGLSQDGESNLVVSEMIPHGVIDVEHDSIDWDILRREIELLNSAWPVILLDLHSLNIDGESILAFSRELSIAIIHIRDEDKRNSLTSLATLYSYLPKFLEGIPGEDINRNKKQTKSYVINAYVLVEQENWEEITKYLAEADRVFRDIISDVEFAKKNEFKINKSFVLLKELESTIEFRDERLFYMQYRNFMQSLNVL
ncbi:MAG: hypothetical protein FWC79_07940 [Oscillospiraceae bacterium]|nr:hypothetical protein [Oscillospiraceae bacterium]